MPTTTKPRKVPSGMNLTESEYTALRHTIASRGTARMTLLAGDLYRLGDRSRNAHRAWQQSPRRRCSHCWFWQAASRPFTRCTWGSNASGVISRSFTKADLTAHVGDDGNVAWPRTAGRRYRSAFHGDFASRHGPEPVSGDRASPDYARIVRDWRDARGASRAGWCAPGGLRRGNAPWTSRAIEPSNCGWRTGRNDYRAKAMASSVTSWVPRQDSVVSNDSRGECASRPSTSAADGNRRNAHAHRQIRVGRSVVESDR